MKSIIFITTNNLTTNPRLVKEIDIAIKSLFNVTVVLFNFGQWTEIIERELRNKLIGVNFIQIDITKKCQLNQVKATSVSLLCNKLNHLSLKFKSLTAFASDKRSFLLHQKLKDLNFNFELIIAHNLGTLYPAYIYSQKHKIPFVFDVEDYHPGELIRSDAKNEKKRRELLILNILPKATHITAASPLIAQEVTNLCNVKVEVINNSFYSDEFVLETSITSSKIRFVWFSQNINYGRGLEMIFLALDKFKVQIELYLIGNLNSDFFEKWIHTREYIQVIEPLSQIELHKKLSSFDVGLALELSSVDYNREIALTNKIFAYKQAGLFILATNTKAQVLFLEQFKNAGYIAEQNVTALANGIQHIIDNITDIRDAKSNRFNEAKTLAFDHEAKSLLTLWESTLNR